MVLQPNFAKRFENEPITTAQIKGTAPRIRTSFHAAASRRRNRTSASKTPRYVVEQAKRRNLNRIASALVRIAAPKQPPPPQAPQADVEMGDTQPSSQPAPEVSTVYTFPIVLPRPEYAEIPKKLIEAVDPALVDVNVQYIRDALCLDIMGPRMYQTISNYTLKDKNILSTGKLQGEITIILDEILTQPPTHMLAIHLPLPKDGSGSKIGVTLIPVHNLILAANCAYMLLIPSVKTFSEDAPEESKEITIPVLPLTSQSPKTFSILINYLYLKNPHVLLQRLLGCPVPPEVKVRYEKQEGLADSIAEKCDTDTLLQKLYVVNGLWRNVCETGVFDDGLWGAMDLSWKILLMALACKPVQKEALGAIRRAIKAVAERLEEQAVEEEEEEEDEEDEEDEEEDEDSEGPPEEYTMEQVSGSEAGVVEQTQNLDGKAEV